MGNKKRINTYSDLVSYYKIQVKRLDEIDDLLDELDGKIKPSLVKRRNELNKVRRELYSEIDKLRDFVMDTLTFDEETFINFITKFYSFYLGMPMKPIKIRDRKVSLFSPPPAFLIVSDRDYDMIMNNFNMKKALNSDKILAECTDDYLYFVGDEVYELANGVYLSSEYETFSEMDDVLCDAVTYRLQNGQVCPVDCLEQAFKQYVRMNTDPFEDEKGVKGQAACRYKTTFVEQSEDPDIFAQIGQEVQRIMEDEKDSVIGTLLEMFMPDRSGDYDDDYDDYDNDNEAPVVSNGGKSLTIDTPVSRIVVKPAGDVQQVAQSGKGRAAEIMEASRQRVAAAQQREELAQPQRTVAEIMEASRQRTAAAQQREELAQPQRVATSHTQGMQATSTSSALFAMLGGQVEMQQPPVQQQVTTQERRGVKVVSRETAPQEKRTQYAATSTVLLNMLSGSQSKKISDEENGKRKVKKY